MIKTSSTVMTPLVLLSTLLVVVIWAGASPVFAVGPTLWVRWVILAAATASMLLLSTDADGGSARSRRLAVIALALSAWGFAALPIVSRADITAGRAISLAMLFVLVFVALPRFAQTPRIFMLVALTTAGSLAAILVGSFVLGLLLPDLAIQALPPGTPRRLAGMLQTPNQLAVLGVLSIPVLVGHAIDRSEPRKRLGLLALAAICTLAVAWTWSRGGLVALAIGLALIGLAAVRRSDPAARRRIVRATVVATTFAVVILGGSVAWCSSSVPCVSNAGIARAQLTDLTSFSNRALLWDAGIEEILRVPEALTGTGLGTAEQVAVSVNLSQNGKTTRPDRALRLHNAYLETLVEMGSVGLLLLLALLAACAGIGWRLALSPAPGAWLWTRLGVAAASSGFLIHETVESFILAVGSSASIAAWVLISLATIRTKDGHHYNR